MSTETLNQSAPSTDIPTGPVPTIMEPTAEQQATNAEAKPAETKATEEKTPEVKAEPKETATTETVEAKAEKQPEEKKAEEDLRFDKHPRFQELIGDNKTLKKDLNQLRQQNQALMQKLEDLGKMRQERTKPVGDELRELYDEDPIRAMERAIEIGEERAAERISKETSERFSRNQLSSALSAFQKDNPDFTDLYESGDLQRVSEDNPLLNTPIAAYLHMKAGNDLKAADAKWEAKVKEEVDKAKAEITKTYEDRIKQIEANHAAKEKITVIDETPASREAITEAGLKSNGRSTSETLFERHKARLRAQGLT